MKYPTISYKLKSRWLAWFVFCATIALIIFTAAPPALAEGAVQSREQSPKVTITVGMPGGSAVHSPEILRRFEELNPDIVVETIEYPWDSFFEKLFLMLVTDTAPDVWYGEAGRALNWYDAGFTADVRPLAERDLDLDEYYFLDAAQDPVTGAWTGIPSDFQVTSLFYNTEHFQTRGLAFPDEFWTTDDLLEAAKKLTVPGEDGTRRWGFALQPDYVTAGWMLWTKLLGGRVLDPTRQKSELNRPDTVEAFRSMTSFMHEMGVSPPPGERDFTPAGAVTAFREGSASMMFNIYAWNRHLVEADVDSYDVEIIPRSPTGERVTTAVPNVWVINRRSSPEKIEAAWRWVKFQISEEAQKIRMGDGAGVPVNQNVGWDFTLLPAPPHNRRIYLESFAFAQTLEENAVWDEYIKAVQSELSPLWAAEITPQDAALRAHQKVEQILSEMT